MTTRVLDITINSVTLLTCVSLIIVADNHKTGNWVAPGVTIILLSILTFIQAVYLLGRLRKTRTKPLNWTLLLPTTVLVLAIYLTWALVTRTH